jgi:RNA 2',3'-cyclic 3'-phosphodiesterase
MARSAGSNTDPARRLFFGVGLDGAATQAVHTLQTHLREQVGRARWTATCNLHLTLRFLGATAPDRLPALQTLLEHAAANHPVCRLRAASLVRWSRLLVIEFAAEPALQALVDTLEHGLQQHGYPAEPRAFRAHLTIARGLDRGVELPAEFRAAPTLDVAVDHLALFESQPGPRGVRYVRCQERPLTGQR